MQYNRPATADYAIDHAGEAFLGEGYAQRYVFRELLSGAKASDAKLEWDFGDGRRRPSRRLSTSTSTPARTR